MKTTHQNFHIGDIITYMKNKKPSKPKTIMDLIHETREVILDDDTIISVELLKIPKENDCQKPGGKKPKKNKKS